VHAVLLTHGKPCPVSDLFGVRGRELLARLDLLQPWQPPPRRGRDLAGETQARRRTSSAFTKSGQRA